MDPKINIGLSDADRRGVVKILSSLLADEFVLYVKARNYHWNVVGPNFNDLHKFFEAQYEALSGTVDEVAERIRALGDFAPATMAEYEKLARLKEHPGSYGDASSMIAGLLADHESIVRYLRKDLDACASKFHDAGTADFLTGLMEEHEKTAWMLRSFSG